MTIDPMMSAPRELVVVAPEGYEFEPNCLVNGGAFVHSCTPGTTAPGGAERPAACAGLAALLPTRSARKRITRHGKHLWHQSCGPKKCIFIGVWNFLVLSAFLWWGFEWALAFVMCCERNAVAQLCCA